MKKFSKSFYQSPVRPVEAVPETKTNLLINDGNFLERFKQMQGLKPGQTPGTKEEQGLIKIIEE